MLTLGTQRDLTNDMLIKGIIDSVVTVNQFYSVLPFKGIQGNALAYNREVQGADQMSLVSTLRTGVSGIKKDQQKFTRHSTELTTIIGDAQVNGLIQAVGSDYNDATAVQVAAKAKGVGRTYMNLLINGNVKGISAGDAVPSDLDAVLIGAGTINLADNAAVAEDDLDTAAKRKAITLAVRGAGAVGAPVTTDNDFLTSGTSEVMTTGGARVYNAAKNLVYGFDGFDGLDALATHTVTGQSTVTGNDRLSHLDLLIDRVHDKDGMVDYMMMNSEGVRKITSAFRDVGDGFTMVDVKTSSGGVMSVQSYRGIPIFRNDFIGTGTVSDLKGGDGNNGTDIYVGTLDDGSMTHGILGLTAKNSAGMQVQKLGAREDTDADITRVKWYCGLAHFSELGLVKGALD